MLNKKEVFVSSLFKTLDQLRGSIDILQLRNYIYILVLYKYISNEKELNDSFIIDIPESSDFSSLLQIVNSSNVLGDELNIRLHKIALSNPILNGVIDYVDFNQEIVFNDRHKSQIIIIELLQLINSFTTNTSTSWVDIFDSLTQIFNESSGKSGDISTPKEICELIAMLIITKKDVNNLSVYDPTCGNGNFLITVSKLINSKTDLFGQDINSESVFLTKLNLIIHGIYNFNIERGDVLNEPKFLDKDSELKNFDIVVANPPFNLKAWDYNQGQDKFDRWNEETGIPPKNSADFAFILHIIKSLKINGIGACIITNGALIRGGNEKEIKKYLVDNGYIRGIIGLPAKMFFGTGVQSSIIIFKNQPNNNQSDLFVIDASSDYYSERNVNKIKPENIERIIETWSQRKELKGFSKVVTHSEIFENDYNLLPARYQNIDELENSPYPVVELGELIAAIPRETTSSNDEQIPFVRIRDLATHPIISKKDFSNLVKVDSPRDASILEENSLLIALVGNELKPTLFIGKNETIYYSSSSIGSYRINTKKVDIEYLIFELSSEYISQQLKNFIGGTTIPYISRRDLQKIRIKLPSLKKQKEIVLAHKTNFILDEEKKLEKHRVDANLNIADENSLLRHRIRGKVRNIKSAFKNLKAIIDNEYIRNNLDLYNLKASVTNRTLREYLNILERDIENVYHATDSAGEDTRLKDVETTEIDIVEFVSQYVSELEERESKCFKLFFEILEEEELFEDGKITVNIKVNEQLLREMFDNLVENAEKHAFKNSYSIKNELHITLGFNFEEMEAQLDFSNTGIPLTRLTKWENALKRGACAGPNSGKGIGLWHVNEIMKLHGGELDFTDETQPDAVINPEFVSTFELFFPIKIESND